MKEVYDGRENMVHHLLWSHADPNVQAHSHATAFSLAVSKELNSVVDMLLAYGAKPDTADDKGKTPGMIAAEKGNLGIVKSLLDLLEAKASPGATDRQGRTMLLLTNSEDIVAAVTAADQSEAHGAVDDEQGS